MKKQDGYILVYILVILAIGMLILTPLLNFMATGLKAGGVFEIKMKQEYAADAGIEDAIWKINHRDDDNSKVPKSHEDDPNYYEYTIDNINDYKVNVFLTCENNLDFGTYRVLSTAGETTIEAIIASIWRDYSGIMDNVITSQAGYTLQGPTTTYPGVGEEHGPIGNYAGVWPTPDEIAQYYWRDVRDVEPETADTILVQDTKYQPPSDDSGLGPFFRDGTLSITNSGTAGLTMQLNGTVYITGDTLIGTTNKDFTLDLNGNAIFVESNTIGSKYALEIGGKCTLTGSGCIIAVGNIQFKPNLDSSPSDYILVMSLSGMTYMQPNGDFYGTLAGSSEVWIQNGDAYWNDPGEIEGGINFPGGNQEGVYWGIFSWKFN